MPAPRCNATVLGNPNDSVPEIESHVAPRRSVSTCEFCSVFVTVSTFALKDLYMTWPQNWKQNGKMGSKKLH